MLKKFLYSTIANIVAVLILIVAAFFGYMFGYVGFRVLGFSQPFSDWGGLGGSLIAYGILTGTSDTYLKNND